MRVRGCVCAYVSTCVRHDGCMCVRACACAWACVRASVVCVNWCACCVRHARACACVWCEHRAWVRARACVRTAAPAFASWLRKACHCSRARRSLFGSSGDGRQARLWAAVLPAAGSAGCGSGAKGLLPGGATPRPSQVGDGMPLTKAAASSVTSHSQEDHRVKADVGRVHRVCHRPVRRADRGSPRACIDDQSSDREGGAHPATRGCEPAGHLGPSASLAPCVRACGRRPPSPLAPKACRCSACSALACRGEWGRSAGAAMGGGVACCDVGQLWVWSEKGLPGGAPPRPSQVGDGQPFTEATESATRPKAILWHQMSAVCTDPYAVQTEARRAHASMVGQGGGAHLAARGLARPLLVHWRPPDRRRNGSGRPRWTRIGHRNGLGKGGTEDAAGDEAS